MLPPEEILTFLHAVPFRPFCIHMASGMMFEIRHPEMVRVGLQSLMFFTFVTDRPELYDRWETISLTLMERISLSEPAFASEGK